MTQPSTPRPVPGPGRPVPGPVVAPAAAPADAPSGRGVVEQGRFAELADRPVAEHVEVFEAEHDRLRSELGTIDRI